MLISHRRAFIYTKTAKTASTSVESYFEPWCMPEGEWQFEHARDEYESEAGVIGYRGPDKPGKTWFNHMPASRIRELVGDATWYDYFKFAVIRDPFDKLVSGYYFSHRHAGLPADPVTGFRRWIAGGGEIMDRHTYTIGGELCMDYFIRYESLSDGVAEVCRRLKLPFTADDLPRLKSGFRNREIPLADFYDDQTAAMVEDRYAFELECFGYSRP
jgi:hypothetical protein